MARAVAGMVVSKPTPKNTRCFSGLPGQFHRIQGGVNHPHLGPLRPQAFQGGVGAGDPEHVAEGDQDHPGSVPRARKASRSDWSVTHTGQPGPEMSSTPGGKRDLRPKRAAAMVWVPQTSMTVAGLSVRAARGL